MSITGRLAAAAGVVATGALSQAAILTWANLAGGSASVATNWNPVQVPTSADVLNWDQGTMTVSFNGAVPASRSMNFRGGLYTLNVGSPHSTGGLVVGGFATVDPSLDIASGTLTTTSVRVGVGASVGQRVLRVTGGATSVSTTGVGDITVGADSGATVEVRGAASLLSADDVSIAGLAGSSCTVTVHDRTVSGFPPVTDRSTLSAAGDVTIGTAGEATVSVTDGGFLLAGGALTLGEGASGVVTMNVGDSPALAPASVSVGGVMRVGANTQAGVAGGAAHVTLFDNATVDANTIIVGDEDSPSLGVMRILGGTVTTQHLDSRFGSLVLRGGTLTVNGGVATPPSTAFIVSGPDSANTPVFRMTNGATMTATANVAAANTAGSFGRIELRTGADLTLSAGGLGLSGVTNSTGSASLLVTDPGTTLTLLGPLTSIGVAGGGTGVMEVQNQAHVSAPLVTVGASAGTTGTMTLSHGSTRVDCTSQLTIGSSGPGSGTVVVQDSAELYPASTVINQTGLLRIDNAVFDTNSVTLNGQMQLVNGSVHAGMIAAGSGSGIVASGVMDTQLISATTGPHAISLTGPLVLGPSTGGTIDWRGDTNLGARVLTLRSTNLARLGHLSMDGGTLDIQHEFGLGATDYVSGWGNVNGAVKFETGSNFDSARHFFGLHFSGAISPMSPGAEVSITGGNVHFEPTCVFTGRGTISSTLFCHGLIVMTGDLTIGSGTNPAIFDSGQTGVLQVGPHTLTLPFPTTHSIGHARLAGGRIVAPTRLFNGRGSLAGSGTIDAPMFSNQDSSFVAPGESGEAGIGALTFLGGYESGNIGHVPGAVRLDIASADARDFDRLVIGGNASLDGALDVTFVDGFVPRSGDTFRIIEAGSITGGFTALNVRTELFGGLQVEYTPTAVVLRYCAADFTHDGGVDGDDVIAFFERWDAGDIGADFTLDGSVDGDDVIGFFGAWDGGC